MGECNHEMPGLPYPAFRMVKAEPGGRQAVPLHFAQLGRDVGAGLVPALPVGMADFRAPTRGAPTFLGSAAMSTEGTASRPLTAKALVDIGVGGNTFALAWQCGKTEKASQKAKPLIS